MNMKLPGSGNWATTTRSAQREGDLLVARDALFQPAVTAQLGCREWVVSKVIGRGGDVHKDRELDD